MKLAFCDRVSADATRPSISNESTQFDRNGGSYATVADSTPGKAETRSSSCLKKLLISAGSLYFAPGKFRSADNTRSDLKPGSTCCSRQKLLISRPAPTTSITATLT